MPTKSSVAKLPLAPGAKGHPPKPPIHASNFLMPSSILTYIFDRASALVS